MEQLGKVRLAITREGHGETRVAASPETVGKFVARGESSASCVRM